MTTQKAKVFYLKKHFEGEPKHSDFETKEEELPALKDGDILLKAEWLSVDPYMRVYMMQYPPGSKMIGGQVARVVQSKHKDYHEGDVVVGYLGWASHSVCNPDTVTPKAGYTAGWFHKVAFDDLPLSYALGVLGMPGVTAYFGFLDICKPKAGDTVVVSGAAGAVGSVVGQIARIKGCRVIGFAGSDEKVEWLKNTCKFDFAYNYKNIGPIEALKEAAPEGVDCYFDNVGGAFSSAVLSQMKSRGRISVCGSISTYNADPFSQPLVPAVQTSLIFKELLMEGFVVTRWIDQFAEAGKELYKWVKSNEIVASEKVYEGFENMPTAFIGMLRGENTGKAVVRA